MHQESIMKEQNSGKKFEVKFRKLFKLKIMHQESIMNEQNSGKKVKGNWREIGGSLSEIFFCLVFVFFTMVTQIDDYVVNNRP